MDFSVKMRTMRGYRGFSQMKVAGDAGVNYFYVNQIESGKRKPTKNEEDRIRTALDFPKTMDAILDLLGAHGGFVK